LEQAPRLLRDEQGVPQAVYLSARDATGLDLLEQALRERLQSSIFEGEIELAPSQGKLRAALFAMGAVTAEAFTDSGGSVLSIRLPEKEWQRLQHQH
jgi:GTP-binding protein HflX